MMIRALTLLLALLVAAPIGAATTVRASATNTAASGTAVSVSAPTGTTTGDLVIVVVTSNGLTTHVNNNGSTPFTEDLNDHQGSAGITATMSVWSRRIQAGDPSTYNFTLGASNRWSVGAVTFQNPHASVIYDVAISTSMTDPASTTMTTNSINTTVNNAIHVVGGGPDSSANAFTGTPSGYTSQYALGTNQGHAFAYKVIAAAGSTGAQSFTLTNSNQAMGFSFAIRDVGTAAAVQRNLTLLGVGM